MTDKTCGNCKHYIAEMFHCQKNDVMAEAFNTCEDFEPKVITNGDKIIAGGMRAIAKFALHHCCNNCVYFDGNNPYRSTCGKPDNKTCEDGVEAWLNAPVEDCVKQNGDHDTQTDLCEADYTESEGEDE